MIDEIWVPIAATRSSCEHLPDSACSAGGDGQPQDRTSAAAQTYPPTGHGRWITTSSAQWWGRVDGGHGCRCTRGRAAAGETTVWAEKIPGTRTVGRILPVDSRGREGQHI